MRIKNIDIRSNVTDAGAGVTVNEVAPAADGDRLSACPDRSALQVASRSPISGATPSALRGRLRCQMTTLAMRDREGAEPCASRSAPSKLTSPTLPELDNSTPIRAS